MRIPAVPAPGGPAKETIIEVLEFCGCAKGDGAPSYVVELTAEGFQVLDTRTEALRADVWSSREQAQGACDELNCCAAPALGVA